MVPSSVPGKAMSHGSTDKCEPNFIPLLDLVLQLVMFFMICANFVMEQTDVAIKLPKAMQAKTIDRMTDQVIYLNVNERGHLILPSTEEYTDSTGTRTKVLDNIDRIAIYLKRKAKEDEQKSGPANKDKVTRSVIILRVHRDCAFDKTYAIMKACRSAGYLQVQLRAELANG